MLVRALVLVRVLLLLLLLLLLVVVLLLLLLLLMLPLLLMVKVMVPYLSPRMVVKSGEVLEGVVDSEVPVVVAKARKKDAAR